MQKVLILGISLVLVVAAIVLAMKKPLPSVQPAVAEGSAPSVIVLGTTNLPGKGMAARFSITNRSHSALVCSPESIEHLDNGSWVTHPFVGKAIWRATREWVGFQEELKPESAFTFTVLAPTNQKSWRVVVRCQERAMLRDTVADTVSKIAATNAVQNETRQFSGKRFSIKRAVVSP